MKGISLGLAIAGILAVGLSATGCQSKTTEGLNSTPIPLDGPSPILGSTWVRPADKMVMVYVPEGNFIMGSNDAYPEEQPVHTVYLDGYWIDQTEVTNSMYALCVKTGICQPPAIVGSYGRNPYFGDSQYGDYPVIYVNWDAAHAYCAWADVRLPTEAEWEKAARGTDGFIYPWGNAQPSSRINLLNYNMEIGDTSPVGTYPSGASPYGAYDMAGNAMEWVNDWYSETYYSQSPETNPTGPASGKYRVLRGGSWGNDQDVVRSSCRENTYPDTFPSYLMGFRCARSQP